MPPTNRTGHAPVASPVRVAPNLRPGTTNSPNAGAPGARAAASPHTAIVVTRQGLVFLDARLRTERLLAAVHPGWCVYDSGNAVVWALNEQPHLELLAVSLSGATSKLVVFPSEANMPPADSVELMYGSGKTLGQLSHFSSVPELQIDLLSRQTLGIDSCDGDAVWYCTETSDNAPEGSEPSFQRSHGFKTQLAALSQGVFIGDEHLDELMTGIRGPDRTRRKTPHKLPIDCHTSGQRGDCGDGFRLEPSPYWAVKTAEVQGDYFHELYHLYDPRAGTYFLPVSPQLRSQLPAELSDWEPGNVAVSADGLWMLENHRVVELEGNAPAMDIEMGCGWL